MPSASRVTTTAGAVYNPLAVANDRLYATDFHNRRVDVFEASFKLIETSGASGTTTCPSRSGLRGVQGPAPRCRRQTAANGQQLMELSGSPSMWSANASRTAWKRLSLQVISTEIDASAAAAALVRGHVGAERIDELLGARDPDGSAFRSLVGPSAIDTLPERTIRFLATTPDFCERFVRRGGLSFTALSHVHWHGSGGIYERLLECEPRKLPR